MAFNISINLSHGRAYHCLIYILTYRGFTQLGRYQLTAWRSCRRSASSDLNNMSPPTAGTALMTIVMLTSATSAGAPAAKLKGSAYEGHHRRWHGSRGGSNGDTAAGFEQC